MYAMRNTGPSVTASVLMLACGSAPDTGSAVVDTNADSITIVQATSSGKYSERFLKELNLHYKDAVLKDSLLVFNAVETFAFPSTPRPGAPITLTTVKGQLRITLTVERVNYTTITYHIEMSDAGKLTYSHSGEADLSPHFHLGAEVDEYSETGLAYLAVEYLDPGEGGCHTAIRLGREDEIGPFLLGKLIKNCNRKIRDIDLYDFPTLIEQRDMGPPIDINELKRRDWLETTSGVLGSKDRAAVCPGDSTSFFGFYELIDNSARGGPFGRLVVRIKEKKARWTYDDTSEEFILLTLKSDRIKLWGKVGVGDHVEKLKALGTHVPDFELGYDKGMFAGMLNEYRITGSTANDTIRVLAVNKMCNQ